MGKKFSGAELAAALRDGALDEPSAPLVGFVKASERQDHISFSVGGCNWVEVPVEMIASARRIGAEACGDAAHPVVELSLSEPTSEMEKTLSRLLSASIAMARLDNASFPGGMGTAPNFPGLGVGTIGPISCEDRHRVCVRQGEGRCFYKLVRCLGGDPYVF